MIKLTYTTLLLIFLTACGSQDTVEKIDSPITKISTEIKIDTNKTLKTTPSKIVPKEREEQSTKILTKNIFTLPTMNGDSLHIDETENGIVFQEHKDKVIFLIFFGHRCPPCVAEIPILKEITSEQNKDLEIIAVEVQGLSTEQLKVFQKKKSINYTLLSGNNKIVSKFTNYIRKRSQWRGSIPFLVALAPNGEVKVVQVGGLSKNTFNGIYSKLSKK